MNALGTKTSQIIATIYCVLFFSLLGLRGHLPDQWHKLANLAMVVLSVGMIIYVTIKERQAKRARSSK